MSRAVLILAASLWLVIAPARAEVIHSPRLGVPAVVVPGGLLEVNAAAKGALSLEGAATAILLDATWAPADGATHVGRAVIPRGTAPGRYALQLVGADATAQRPGAVHVLEDVSEDYALAILYGSKSAEATGPLSPFPADLGARLRAESVQLAILQGPLTRDGSVEAYQALEALLLASEVPIYLCPDATDLQSPHFRAHFGDAIQGVTFGKDGYLFLGAGLAAADPQTHARLGEAHRLRRVLRASRWSIGVASRYDLNWDLRAQIALFVDDPLDFLIVGTAPVEFGTTLPWGKTEFAPPPGTPKGLMTVLDVSATGIRPRPQPEAASTSASDQASADE